MKFNIKPEDHELRKARNLVEEALETCDAFMEKEEAFTVSIGWLEDGQSGANGGSSSEESIFVNFNTSQENWEKQLRTAAAYGYAQSVFLEKAGWEQIEFYWQEILMEGFSLLFVEKVFPEESENELPEIDREVLENEWNDWKKDLSTEIMPGDYFPWEYGYLVGQELLEKHGLEEFTNMKRGDVEDAGDRLFS